MLDKICKGLLVKNKTCYTKVLFQYPIKHMSNAPSATPEGKSNNLIKHNFHAECEEGLNHQINQEFCVSYVYLYMSSIFSKYDVALLGFAKFFQQAASEEIQHAHKLIEFLNKRGGQLALKTIIAPEKKDWSNPICAIQCSIDLEKQVTQSLEALHARGQKHKDNHLCDFIETYYLTEQYDAIKKLGDLLTSLKKAGPGLGAVLIDMELSRPKALSAYSKFHEASS